MLYLPGAAIFRAPVLEREARKASTRTSAATGIVVSVARLTSMVAFGLAAAHRYSIGRLLAANAVRVVAIPAVTAAGCGCRRRHARRLAALAPIALVAACAWLFFPPRVHRRREGTGRLHQRGDPDRQRGALITHDALIASVPAPLRNLFYPPGHRGRHGHTPLRFMGFFILDRTAAGTVVGQFPHLYPVGRDRVRARTDSPARSHALAGSPSSRLRLFFLGCGLLGRHHAGVAAALLAVSVVEVWFRAYLNAEMLMQAASSCPGCWRSSGRTWTKTRSVLAPVAAVLLGLLFFARPLSRCGRGRDRRRRAARAVRGACGCARRTSSRPLVLFGLSRSRTPSRSRRRTASCRSPS